MRARSHSAASSLVTELLTLSLILSVLSGSPPPPPRFLSSVMFRLFRYRDVNVSHKPTPEGGEGGEEGRQGGRRG